MGAVLCCEIVTPVQEQIRSLALATDNKRQQELLTTLNEYLETHRLDMNDTAVCHFVSQIALKCVDKITPWHELHAPTNGA